MIVFYPYLHRKILFQLKLKSPAVGTYGKGFSVLFLGPGFEPGTCFHVG